MSVLYLGGCPYQTPYTLMDHVQGESGAYPGKTQHKVEMLPGCDTCQA